MPELTRRSMTLGLVAAGILPNVANASSGNATKPRGNPILGTGGLHHAAVRTRDWDKTLAFYEKALGFTVKLAWKEAAGSVDDRISASGTALEGFRWAYLDSGDGTCIEIFEDPSFVPLAAGASDPTKNPGGPVVHFGLRTSRIDQVCEHARAHGAIVIDKPVDFTLNSTNGKGAVVVRICYLQGPSGEYIELLQNPP